MKKLLLPLWISLVTVLGIVNSVSAQVSTDRSPRSFGELKLSDAVPAISLPPINRSQLLAEDEREEKLGLPWRFGKDIDVDLSLLNSGVWTDLPGGDRIWRLKISTEGAYSINLIYDRFFLPEGATLHLYSADKTYVLGAFTSDNNKPNGKFATGLVKGSSCILEYFEPQSQRGKGIISISKAIHGYKNLFNRGDKGYGGSGSCNNNVNCPVGSGWQDEKKSVALILTSGNSRICTGALVNNAKQDKTPYFLTANHCYSSRSDTENWIFMFNYESPGCPNTDGPTNQTVSGCTVKAKNSDSDFLLLELSVSPPESYNAYYAGWTRANTSSTSSVGIHHPKGDIKKISFDNNAAISSDYDPRPYLADSHWEVRAWDDGTTEPGSSGSPLFDQNHRVTGQLHGGWASCSSITADFYGKFSMSWDRGSSPDTRLKDWLDPSNTGLVTLNGTYGNSCAENLTITSPVNASGSFQASNSITASSTVAQNITVSYQAGKSITLRPGFSVNTGNNGRFTATIKACDTQARETRMASADAAGEEGYENTLSSDLLRVFPNPVKDKLTISFQHSESKPGLMSFELYNVMGLRVLDNPFSGPITDIDVAHLKRGIYFLKFKFGDKALTRKVILD